MAEHDAIRQLSEQVDAHIEALDNEELTPGERAAILRNLSKVCRSWDKTLAKEAASLDARIFVAAQKKAPRVRSAA